MEKATRETDANSVEEHYVLPSTFSPWPGHEDEPDFAHSRGQLTPSSTSSSPPPERSKEHLSSYVAEDEVVRPPLARRISPFRRSTPTPSTHQDDEQLMLRPDDHGMQPVTETIISAGDTPQKRGTVRRTRFTELLGRSLSLSLLGKKVPSSPSIGSNYNTIEEEPPAQHGSEHYPMDSVNIPQLNVERERCGSPGSSSSDDEDVDLDELATKYGTSDTPLSPYLLCFSCLDSNKFPRTAAFGLPFKARCVHQTLELDIHRLGFVIHVFHSS